MAELARLGSISKPVAEAEQSALIDNYCALHQLNRKQSAVL